MSAGPLRFPTWRDSPFYSALVVCIFAAIAMLLYWPVQPLSGTRLLSCGCFDPALDAWFIAWTPNALLHHLNPLFTTTIDYPSGINLAANTFMPLLGVLVVPVTLLLGPVASVNLLFRLGFVLSATSMYFVLGRFVVARRAAFVGALFYGFSPYMIGQGSLHLNLVFVPLPPLILACLDELFIVRSRSPYRVGLLLGGLCAAQYMISVEVLADLALVIFVGAVAIALRYPRATWRALGHMARGVLAALVPIAVVCGYPIWFEMFGRQHIGYTQAFGAEENVNEDLLSLIVPTSHEIVGGARLISLGSSYVGSNLTENGGYIGATVLLAVIATLVLRWRNPVVRYCALLALVADSLSLGRSLIVDNHNTGIPMPFDALWSLPLLSSELPARYSLFVDLFVAVVLAIGLDAVLTGSKAIWASSVEVSVPPEDWAASLTATGSPSLGTVSQAPPDGAAGMAPIVARLARSAMVRFWLLAAVVLLPLIPRFGYFQPPTQVPSAFLASAEARSIPKGSVVLSYPYNAPPWNYAMLWQADARFPFKLIGGYGVTPNPGNVDYPALLQPAAMYNLFEAAWNDAKPPPFDEATFSQMRRFCITWHVSTILVVPIAGDLKAVERYLTAALGPGQMVDGVDVWSNVGARAEARQPARPGQRVVFGTPAAAPQAG